MSSRITMKRRRGESKMEDTDCHLNMLRPLFNGPLQCGSWIVFVILSSVPFSLSPRGSFPLLLERPLELALLIQHVLAAGRKWKPMRLANYASSMPRRGSLGRAWKLPRWEKRARTTFQLNSRARFKTVKVENTYKHGVHTSAGNDFVDDRHSKYAHA